MMRTITMMMNGMFKPSSDRVDGIYTASSEKPVLHWRNIFIPIEYPHSLELLFLSITLLIAIK